jgi:hypothetical protein
MAVSEQGRPDLSSRKTDFVKNDDGSVDVYFGPLPLISRQHHGAASRQRRSAARHRNHRPRME